MTTKNAPDRGGAATLSLLGAVLILGLKFGAYAVTGSVGLLSDAAESLVNLVAAVALIVAIGVAATPPDYRHPYGHAKAEYISSVLEAALILVAAIVIGVSAIRRLLDPQPLEQVGLGLGLAAVAAVVNGLLAWRLFRVAKATSSAALQANATHLMTDVWTSVGVVVAVAAVALTGWWRLDSIIALVVAANIVWTGWKLVRQALRGLLDESIPRAQRQVVVGILDSYYDLGVRYHALLTRQAAGRSFFSVHVLVPGDWTVAHAHDIAEEIETRIRAAIPGASPITHLEPVESPASYEDVHLDR